MKSDGLYIFVFIAAQLFSCAKEDGPYGFSGVYCLNIQSLEMVILQTDDEVSFSLQSEILTNGTGMVSGDTIMLSAITNESGSFSGKIIFSKDRKSFSGTFEIFDAIGTKTMEGVLQGVKGDCPKYDIDLRGIPKFAERDFTDLSKIMEISKFRSGTGHSYTDDFEECRSMKHYYCPFENFRNNNTVPIYTPVTGTILSISDDGHGASIGLNNKLINIMPDNQPAFTVILFHCDLASPEIAMGKRVLAGELLGYGRFYYDDLDEYTACIDIAVAVNTPSGMRNVSFFDILTDDVFNNYIAKGAVSRQDFIISKEERNADPLECNGEAFLTTGNIENWFIFQ